MPKRAIKGFVLLEVIISLTLLGITFTLLLNGFNFVSKAWEKGLRKTSLASDYQVVQKIFEQLAEGAFPVVVTQDSSDKYAFIGGKDYLKIAHFSPPYPSSAGLYETTLIIDQESGKSEIYLKRAPFNGESFFDKNNLSKKDDSLVFSSKSLLSFSYLSQAEGDDEPTWTDELAEPTQMPLMIRLNFPENKENPGKEPDIVAPLEINIDSHCVNPVIDGYCRLDRDITT